MKPTPQPGVATSSGMRDNRFHDEDNLIFIDLSRGIRQKEKRFHPISIPVYDLQAAVSFHHLPDSRLCRSVFGVIFIDTIIYREYLSGLLFEN